MKTLSAFQKIFLYKEMKKGFTLVEVVLVTLIMAIILSMTVLFGSDYLKDLQLRTEKEGVLNTINYTLSYAKSTNYYKGDRFTHIDVLLGGTGVEVILDSGTGFGLDLLLTRSELQLSGTSNTIRLFPYARACIDVVNDQDMVSFSLESTRSDDVFCFDRDMRLCKIFVVSCP